ncbi:hypothetical protein RJ639_040141 [Escallonia herrerae]|uniref:Integrase catalytic domain-containing protein n=1 Tax=Escallonia herrerae TaxID=1293975 RepID=A0AA88WP07_9ASTE|nr:hypothetical protein RJ639_040141 [Escallonia herrerae]
MNIPTNRLRKTDSSLYGFSNHSVAVEGIITLPIAIGTPPIQANLMLDFVVVKVPSAYNAILGRPALNQLQAMVSTYHLKMKFPTENGIEEVKGDQTIAREDKTDRIGLNLKEDTKLELVNLLRTYADVFAWTAADMPGIDREAIRKAKNFAWMDECQTSFEELKTYLSSSPLLSKTFPGEDLFLYLSITEVAVSAVLVREGDGVQKPIYCVSKVLQDVETRYPKIDRIVLALITSARRLRPYFQSHSIIVLTDQPLRKVLLSPEASGRRPPQLVISEVIDPWNLYVDGSSAVGSSEVGIILISPEGFTIEYALRFSFQASNNEAEYEALLTGIRLAHALRVDSLSVHSDSQLVVNHVDALSRLASTEATDVRRSVYLEFLKDRSISSQIEIGIIDQDPCWMDTIIKFLSTSELPSERHEARNLRVRAARYALVEGVLYKKSFSLPYLRCLRQSESVYALQEGMDLLGPFLVASGQRRFMIVAIDYFTKWTEAESLATITSAKCEDFFWKNVVCRFGVPRALVVDNGKQFDNNNFQTFCTNLSIDLRFTSVAHPQSNGQTENMNRSILQGLKKKLDEAKGTWVDELSKVLWAYRTTPHSVTGETHFCLCYGTEALLPVEIRVPSIRALHFNEGDRGPDLIKTPIF